MDGEVTPCKAMEGGLVRSLDSSDHPTQRGGWVKLIFIYRSHYVWYITWLIPAGKVFAFLPTRKVSQSVSFTQPICKCMR